MSTFYLSVYEEGELKHTFTVPEIGTLFLPGILISKYLCRYNSCFLSVKSSETEDEPLCYLDYDRLQSPIFLVKRIKKPFYGGKLVLLFDEREITESSPSPDSQNNANKNPDSAVNEKSYNPESGRCVEEYLKYCGDVQDKLSFARDTVATISFSIEQLGTGIRKLQLGIQTDLNRLSEHLSPDLELFISPIRYLDELMMQAISPKTADSQEWRDLHDSLTSIRTDLKYACAEVGIQEFWPKNGEPYTPLRHFSNEVPGGEGTLIVRNVLYCGFQAGERILRKAEVVLERGDD